MRLYSDTVLRWNEGEKERKHEGKRIMIVFYALLQMSCVGYYTTAENGYRLKDPGDFKYSKPKFTSGSKALIDTNSIYVMDSVYYKGTDEPMTRKGDKFVRFFSGGQALFVDHEGIPDLDKINNKNIGMPAYYILEGNKIKVEIFEIINGGQTMFYFGKIQENGNIVFYEDSGILINFPVRILKSFKSLENGGRESYWTKIKIENMDPYKPDW